MGHANTFQATVQQLAVGLGVAGGVIALRLGHPIGDVVAGSTNAEAPYTVAFLLAGLASLVATAGAFRLKPSAGDILRGARSPETGATRQVESQPA
jgi:hypothetical protein